MKRPVAHSHRVGALATLVLTIGLLAACSLPLPKAALPGSGATPGPSATGEPASTGPSVSFEGVSFVLDAAIAAAANGAQMPDTSDPNTPPEIDKGPARIAFSFDGYTGPTGTIPALVYVYDLADLAGKPEEATANGLAALLQERPDLVGQQELPFLPDMNAGQALHAREAYRDFASGAGIEYLALYGQDASPITADRLWYTFQGLTGDGRRYVAAVFPLQTDLFPAELAADFDYEEWFAGYDQYIADARKALGEAPADRFAPSLDALDALVQSISVETAPAVSQEPVAEPATAGFAGTYTASLPAADTPGQTITLVLAGDGAATMSTDYMNGEPAIAERGTWLDNGDGTATVTFTHVDQNELATPDVITFALQEDLLVATEYDVEVYGSEGLALQRSDEAAGGAPAATTPPAETALPTETAPPTEVAPPAAPVASGEIVGVTWQLQEVRRANGAATTVADPSKYALTLNADGSVAIVADCNTGAGQFEVDGGEISFRELSTTFMACPQPSLGGQFTKLLEFVDGYAVDDGNLVLSYSHGAGTLAFAPASQ